MLNLSLELLLHEALSSDPVLKRQLSSGSSSGESNIVTLQQAIDLLRCFPNFHELLTSCVRKHVSCTRLLAGLKRIL